jgi:hypothetical protein
MKKLSVLFFSVNSPGTARQGRCVVSVVENP